MRNTPRPLPVESPLPHFLSPQRNVGNEDSGHRNRINLASAQGTSPAQFTGEVIKHSGRRSVLVVDDEENFLTLLKWFLTARGFDIVTTPSAEESLDLVEQQDFDIALLDIKLGTTDGLTLMDLLTERQPGLKVIVMTAYPTVGSIRQAFDKGASRYFTKPVDLQQLSEAIQSL